MACKPRANCRCAPGQDVCGTDPFRCLFMAASADKEDMICLNDRLGDVVAKVDKLRSGSGQDSSTFIKTIDCLKDEIKKIKTAYDLELSRLRRECEIILGDKSAAQCSNEKLRTSLNNAQARLEDEARENQKRRDAIAALKSDARQKDSCISELSGHNDCLKSELELMSAKLDKYRCEMEAANQRCDSERRLRHDAEDCKAQLTSKLAFDADVHQQRVGDLEQRLANQQSIVEALNDQLRMSTSNDGKEAMTNVVLRLREQMAAEFDKYRTDAEAAMNKTLSDMRTTLDDRMKEKMALEEERDYVKETVGKLQGQLSQIQAEVRSAHDCNEQLQATLQTERQQALCQSRDMEARLLDAQNGLMDKVREVTAARDAQTALKSEIASLRALIESAEMRVNPPCLPPVSSGHGPTSVSCAGTTQGYPAGDLQPCRAACPPAKCAFQRQRPVIGNKALLSITRSSIASNETKSPQVRFADNCCKRH